MNDDRIAEVYEGKRGTAETQRIARERVHWMCRAARGTDVLDIGCSQGIVSVLLGREGKRVVGVDRESSAIAESTRRLGEEEQDVRERVRFVKADAAELGVPDASFDSVILGEVIEHVVDPRRLLSEAARLLRPSGVLVLTTPYGLFRYPDHKDPIYLLDLIGLLAGYRITELDLIHHFVGVVATPAAAKRARAALYARALWLAEQRLTGQDLKLDRQSEVLENQRAEVQRLRGEAGQTRFDADQARTEADQARTDAEQARAEAEHARAGAVEAETRLAATLARADELDRALTMNETRFAELEVELEVLAEAVHERDARLFSLERERDTLLQAYETAQTAIARLRAPVDAAIRAADGGADPELSRLATSRTSAEV